MRTRRRSGLIATALLLGVSLLAAPHATGSGPPDGAGPIPPGAGPNQPDGTPETDHFQKVSLNDSPGEPISLTVLPDRRVLHATRDGSIWLHDQETGVNSVAGELDVYTHDEEGLQNIEIDPDFDGQDNTWVYLYYSPPLDTEPDNGAPDEGEPEDFAEFEGHTLLSRVQLDGDTLDFDTEQHIIEVAQDRGICCHVAGDITFDSDGNLLLATGDDSNPFASDGYTPIDERPERNPAYDAQRSSGNTNDLRGKVLRITVQEDGSYTVPEGNLFEAGTPDARDEIYLMGLRNPFRMDFDHRTQELYVADYSPDANDPDPERGPEGNAKWFVTDEPGNWGWPFCSTPEKPYVEWDFATEEAGEPFDCAAPVNNSPRNTGMTELPPVQQPQIWYNYEKSDEFPELADGGQGPMAGPAYDFDKRTAVGPRAVAWPEYYDGMPLFYEYTRDYFKGFRLDADGSVEIEDVLPGLDLAAPIDLEFGPDGALYVLEYGYGYFDENPEAQLSRIDYVGPHGNRSPEPVASSDVTDGLAPLTVEFSSEGTSDPDGDDVTYEWDFTGDGTVDSTEAHPSFTYEENGSYQATLRVTDQVRGKPHQRSASTHVTIVVGNTEPEVEFVKPAEGDSFEFGDTVDFEVSVTDEQEVDCDRVTVTYILGHDNHGHPMSTERGCEGTIDTPLAGGHDPEHDDLAGVFVAEYVNPGQDGAPDLSGRDEVVLEPTGH